MNLKGTPLELQRDTSQVLHRSEQSWNCLKNNCGIRKVPSATSRSNEHSSFYGHATKEQDGSIGPPTTASPTRPLPSFIAKEHICCSRLFTSQMDASRKYLAQGKSPLELAHSWNWLDLLWDLQPMQS